MKVWTCSAMFLLFACGTNPGSVVSDDSSRADDVGIATDTEPELATTDVRDVPSVDVSDTPPTDIDAALPFDVSTDVDHAPVLTACGMELICKQSGRIVDEPAVLRDVRDSEEGVYCEIQPPPGVGLVRVRGFELGNSVPLFDYSTDPDEPFAVGGGVGSIGTYFAEATLSSEGQTCRFVSPAVVTAPPSDRVFVALEWREEVDNDLHLTRTDRPCWGMDSTHHSVLNVREYVDWGVRFESEDDPDASLDAQRGADSPETMQWYRNASEAWTIKVHVLSGGAVAPTAVRVRLFDHGRLLLDEQRSFDATAFWDVALVQDGRVSVIDDPAGARPEDCVCEDGTPIRPETCNGIDDDCNGTIDDEDAVCLNQEGRPLGVCAHINEEIGFACF